MFTDIPLGVPDVLMVDLQECTVFDVGRQCRRPFRADIDRDGNTMAAHDGT